MGKIKLLVGMALMCAVGMQAGPIPGGQCEDGTVAEWNALGADGCIIGSTGIVARNILIDFVNLGVTGSTLVNYTEIPQSPYIGNPAYNVAFGFSLRIPVIVPIFDNDQASGFANLHSDFSMEPGIAYFFSNQALSTAGSVVDFGSGPTGSPEFTTGTAFSDFDLPLGAGSPNTVAELQLFNNFVTTADVPEPGTYALMASGLVGMIAFARRRRA